MSKKNLPLFAFFLVTLCFTRLNLSSQGSLTPAERLKEAHRLFESGEFQPALLAYEGLYSEGIFSEKMLIRMCELEEKTRNYPMAIFYLRKSAQEFGSEAVDSKIRQLMQIQGSSKYYSQSGWDGFIRFFNGWGWLIWVAFASAAISLAGGILFYRKLPGWARMTMSFGMWPLFFMAGTAIFLRLYMIPDRGVLVQPTGYYSDPGFGASWTPDKLSLGELVEITDESDIWVEVKAGSTVCWVPNWAIRRL